MTYHQAAQKETGFRETATLFAPLITLQVLRLGMCWRRRALGARG